MGYAPTLRQATAAELRAEMARQRKTGVELAALLECSQQSASRRMNGDVDMSLDEIAKIADWLGVPFAQLVAAPTAEVAS
jgi:transcriptional regulator with XRE-family HTH domain